MSWVDARLLKLCIALIKRPRASRSQLLAPGFNHCATVPASPNSHPGFPSPSTVRLSPCPTIYPLPQSRHPRRSPALATLASFLNHPPSVYLRASPIKISTIFPLPQPPAHRGHRVLVSPRVHTSLQLLACLNHVSALAHRLECSLDDSPTVLACVGEACLARRASHASCRLLVASLSELETFC